MENKEDKIKFSERFSLILRKTIIVSKLFTILLVVVLILAFIGLNVWLKDIELPDIDITTNKVYTLSDESKDALAALDQDVKIYAFGIDEENPILGLIKQYKDASDKIEYELLASESNLEKVKAFGLEDGNSCVVLESGETNKVISTYEFQTMDYNTGETIDKTEQVLTNSILGFTVANKPKIYFVTGHDEFGENMTSKFKEALEDESMEVETLNLITAGNVPEDCDVLVVLSPSSDFLEGEAQAVLDYIGKGGNLLVTKDLLSQDAPLPNFTRILDQYGVSVENGYILETDANYTVPNAPYIFMPQISSASQITADIASERGMVVTFCERVTVKSEEELSALNVTNEELLGTSDKALFISDLTMDTATAAQNAESGHFTIASVLTKTVSEAAAENAEESAESEEEEDSGVQSKLVISANGAFLTDSIVSEISSQVSLIEIGNNKDFAVNAVASLADKEDGLTIKKTLDVKSDVYTVSENQNRVVMGIVFGVPIVIMIAGILVWGHRKKRK